MRAPGVTVAVLSHRRPRLLPRVLRAVAQLDYPAFEIVVVGDQPTLAHYELPHSIASQVRYAHLEDANVSRARNVAIAMAGGEIVAFCDDDAAPEPDWLLRLAKVFDDPAVAAASGTVLAADGRTVEWQGTLFCKAAREWPRAADVAGMITVVPAARQVEEDRYLGLIGVNAAFRRSALIGCGGFDEAYRYFLDETDMAIRLARAGWSAALVPGAVVHHLRDQNQVRTSRKVPRDLYQVAASKAHFCHRHMPQEAVGAELERYRAARLCELDPFLRIGTLRADGLRRLRARLNKGLRDGARRAPSMPLAPGDPAKFTPFRAPPDRLRVALLSGWGIGHIRSVRRLARQLAAAGHAVTCFTYTSGPQPERISFAQGVWVHQGGTWRLDGKLTALSRSARGEAEMARVAPHRSFDVVLRPARMSAGAVLVVPGLATQLAIEPAGSGKMPPGARAAVERALAGPEIPPARAHAPGAELRYT